MNPAEVRMPFDVRFSRASTRAKIALVRALCRAFGVFGATRFLLSTIDWGELKPGRPSVLCLYRPLFAKDLEELRRRTNVNWLYVNNEFLAHVQSAWVPAEMRVEAEYQKTHLPQYEPYWAQLERFGVGFLSALHRQWPIDAVMASHIDYWHGEGVRLGARRLGIPFLALCREHMCLPIEQETVRRFFTGFKWEGDGVAVFGQSTKDIFVNSGACRADQVVVTGPPRLDIWRDVPPRVEPNNLIILLSYRDPDYRAPRSFLETLRIFRDVAARSPDDAVFWVKSKDAKDTEEIRALVGSARRNFVIDHDAPLYELFPRARLVVGFNSLSIVEALLTSARVAIPCWGDADRQREELIFNPDDAGSAGIIDFARSPEALREQLALAAVGRLAEPASTAARRGVVQKILHYPDEHSCSQAVENFVTAQIRAHGKPAVQAPRPARRGAPAWTPLGVFLACLALAGGAGLLGAPAIVSTILAAPLYYLLPLGCGLLATQPLAAFVTRTQRAFLAYLCGLVLICAVMVIREQARPEHISIHFFSLPLLVAAMAGFAVGHRFFRWNKAARSLAQDFLIVLPVFASGWIIRFGIFSDYPITDLFQATHLMKGAQEFGRFDILNPFTADSYVPAIQVMEGLLVRYFAFDGLLAVWIVPLFAAIPKFLACRAIFQSVLRTRESTLFATAVTVCFLSVLTPTNGDLAALGSLLLFSLAASTMTAGRGPGAPWTLFTGLAALAVGFFATRSAPLVYLLACAALCLLPLARPRLPMSLVAVALLIVVLTPLHRSTLAFIPLALLLGVLLPVLNAWLGRQRASARIVGSAVGVLTAIAGAWTIGLLAWIVVHPDQDMREARLYDWLLDVLLGATASGSNVVVGAGPKVALFELGRVMSPSFAVLAGICVTLGFLQAVRWPVLARGAGWTATRESLVAWGLAVTLGGVLLTGVPFVYRSGFLVIVLLAIALAAAFDAFAEAKAKLLYRAVLLIAATYVVAVIPLAYRCGAITRCIAPEYVELVSPFVLGLGTVVFIAAAFGVFFAHGGRVFRYATKAVIVLLFALEIGINRAYFMPYAYGAKLPGDQKAVSHLSRGEIALAAELRNLKNPVVLISDPFTMANLRALTGLNSVVTYANLDTLSAIGGTRLRKWLRDTIESDAASPECAREHPLDITYDSANGAEFNYWLARLTRGQRDSGREILHTFGFRIGFLSTPDRSLQRRSDRPPDHEWRRRAIQDGFPGEAPLVLLVVDQKTVAWARDEALSYFPDTRPLDPKLIASLRARCAVDIYDNRFAVIRFSMDN
jgi:hypothetical protein